VVTVKNRTFTRVEQDVALTKPDKKATVRGPRAENETLVLDGKVDGFIAAECSHFPMGGLKDLKDLLESKTFADLQARRLRDRHDNWIFHSGPNTPHSTTLKISPGPEGLEVNWGLQKAVIKHDSVTLHSRTHSLGHWTMDHTIHGEKNAKGNFVCTAETYSFRSGNDGNLWGNDATFLNS
jgi:hypothetical protein